MEPLTARWRQTVASYETHSQARAAVDTLVRKGFPAEELTIVAEDVRRLRRSKRYLLGALLGAAFGAVLVTLAVHGLVIATAAAGLAALVARRPAGSVEADRYVVVCDGETADEAAALLRSSWKH